MSLRVFYDLECPDSRDDHYFLKEILSKPSKMNGKTYGDLVDIHVTTFVLPYHVHSY